MTKIIKDLKITNGCSVGDILNLTEGFEIFTICRRPPVLQTDARVGMMKIVVRETEARKASGRRTSTPR